MPRPPAMRGVRRHEVVAIEHQTWLAVRAFCAGCPVCAFVRAFPWWRCAGGASHSIRPDAVSEAAQQPASNHDSDRQQSDACAICAVLALANATLFATPPLLWLPQAVEILYLTTDAEFVHLNSAGVAFQTRAP